MADAFDLADFLRHLTRRWLVVAVAVGTAACGVAGWAWTTPPRYVASARILIHPPAGEGSQWPAAMSGTYMESLKTFELLATGDGLLRAAAEATGLPFGVVRSNVRASLAGNTRILEISAELTDPAKALELARWVAQRTITLGSSDAPGRETLELVDAGALPESPSWPNRPAAVAGAMLTALVASLAFVSLEFAVKTPRP